MSHAWIIIDKSIFQWWRDEIKKKNNSMFYIFNWFTLQIHTTVEIYVLKSHKKKQIYEKFSTKTFSEKKKWRSTTTEKKRRLCFILF